MSDATNGFRREVSFSPAFDKRDPDPKKNYGIHGVGLMFTLAKDGKGITLSIFTNWQLPHVQAEMDAKRPDLRFPYLSHKPMAADVSFHDSKPHYEGHTCREGCAVTGGDCYSDGSGLMAEEGFTALREGGSDGVWKWMEERYAAWLTDDVSSAEGGQP